MTKSKFAVGDTVIINGRGSWASEQYFGKAIVIEGIQLHTTVSLGYFIYSKDMATGAAVWENECRKISKLEKAMK